ncbi:MAG: hypothetical protein F4Z80_00110 [Chloroflexi bacterium]|nr:hypothetical protein [Chloroflexota bacterium]MYC48668.1 hypothetical protein [Chloroflexota bacterium]
MTDEYVSPPELVFQIEDSTLPLAALEEIASTYPQSTGSPITILSKWGGPAATGLEVEVAVVIIASQLLRSIGSDVYELVKREIVSVYKKIRPTGPAREYQMAAMALIFESENKPDDVILRFCFPPGLSDAEILERWRNIESDFDRLKSEWFNRASNRQKVGAHNRISLSFDPQSGKWREIGHGGFIRNRSRDQSN